MTIQGNLRQSDISNLLSNAYVLLFDECRDRTDIFAMYIPGLYTHFPLNLLHLKRKFFLSKSNVIENVFLYTVAQMQRF